MTVDRDGLENDSQLAQWTEQVVQFVEMPLSM